MNIVLIAAQILKKDILLYIHEGVAAAGLASDSIWSAALPESHCSNPQPDTRKHWGANPTSIERKGNVPISCSKIGKYFY